MLIYFFLKKGQMNESKEENENEKVKERQKKNVNKINKVSFSREKEQSALKRNN